MSDPVLLKCGCWRNYTRPVPVFGEELTCRHHGPTIVVHSVNYKIRCLDCTYSPRQFGNDPVTTEVKAVSHSVRKHHTVRVTKLVDSKHDSEYKVGGNTRVTLDEILDPR